jgi:hypothetical protein
VPDAHAVQAAGVEAPTVLEYVPAGHAMHTALLLAPSAVE